MQQEIQNMDIKDLLNDDELIRTYPFLRRLCYKIYIKKLYYEVKDLLPADFLRKLQIEFPQRYWELWLMAHFKKCCQITRNPTDLGPDITITLGDTKVHVEANIPNQGTTKDQVLPFPIVSMHDVKDDKTGLVVSDENKRVEKMALRYANSINEKKIQYEKWIADNVIYPSECYILALNSYYLEDVHINDPLSIETTLFSIGPDSVILDRTTLQPQRYEFMRKETITKHTGTEVKIGHFLDKNFDFISGILYSSRLFDPLQQCILIKNPYAKNPLPDDSDLSVLKLHILAMEENQYKSYKGRIYRFNTK